MYECAVLAVLPQSFLYLFALTSTYAPEKHFSNHQTTADAAPNELRFHHQY